MTSYHVTVYLKLNRQRQSVIYLLITVICNCSFCIYIVAKDRVGLPGLIAKFHTPNVRAIDVRDFSGRAFL